MDLLTLSELRSLCDTEPHYDTVKYPRVTMSLTNVIPFITLPCLSCVSFI